MDLRRFTLCFAVALSMASLEGNADAAVVPPPTTSVPPHPSLSGYLSYSFIIDLSGGEAVAGMAVSFMAPNGDMFQVHPIIMGSPAPTPTNDRNFHPAFVATGFTGADDSQFNFSVLDWDIATSINDSPSLLDIVATNEVPGGFGPISTDIDLAHVVIPATSFGSYIIDLTFAGGATQSIPGTFGVVPIPEASQVLAGIVLLTSMFGVSIVRRRQIKHSAPA
jgi:hypothetical protein